MFKALASKVTLSLSKWSLIVIISEALIAPFAIAVIGCFQSNGGGVGNKECCHSKTSELHSFLNKYY
jgi:hypothetical protein